MDFLKDESYKNLQGLNVKASLYQTPQFLDLRNYCFIKPGSLSTRIGQETLLAIPKSTFLQKPSSTLEYIKNDGSTFVIYDSGTTLYNMPMTAIGRSLTPNATTALVIDSVVQNDLLYYGNGHAFNIFDGFVSYYYKSSTTRFNDFGSVGVTYNTSLNPGGVTAVIPPGGYYFFLTPVRSAVGNTQITQYGLPVDLNTKPNTNAVGDGFGFLVTLTATISAVGKWVAFGFTVAADHGYSSIAIEYQKGSSLNLEPYTARILNTIKSQSTFTWGLSTFGGAATVFGVEFEHFTLSADWESQYPISGSPRFLETYNNMLFFSGMSFYPFRAFYSEVGEPERVKEENFFDIVTGDNESITGIIFYQDALLFFKKHSIHELTGVSPSDLTLRSVNLDYGSLNNEGIVVFENKLWFIDEKGICEYNAANTRIVSDPIETILDTVDKTKIKAFHNKDQHEVWFCADNLCFIYDYFGESWTIYDPIAIDRSSGANVVNFADKEDPVYWINGTSHYLYSHFNPSLSTDFGQAITLIGKTKFHKRMGESTEEMWRRFYINADSATVFGATLNFRQNYGSSIVLTRGTSFMSYQDRVDFGIPAKSLSVEFIIQSAQSIRVNGYTIESRYLRPV